MQTKKINHKTIQNLLNDFETFPKLLEDNLKDIYYWKVRPEDMNFIDVCDAIYNLIGENPKYVDKIKRIVKKYQITEKKRNRRIFENNVYHDRIGQKWFKIKSWFTCLPIILITRGFRLIIQLYMRVLGYKCYVNKTRCSNLAYNL